MPTSYREKLNEIYTYQHEQFKALHERQRKEPNEKGTLEMHAGLWLDKYIEKQERDDVGVRAQLAREVATLAEPDVYQQFYDRWRGYLKEQGAQVREAHAKGRMVVGLGSESVLETSIALHRTYGMPYIPGSSLKGLTASYVRNYLREEWQAGNDSKAFNVLFGDTEGAGYITFFDALYIPGTGGGEQKKVLYPDVITVHHQQYYQGGTDSAPADWDSPIPVPFLSATGHYLIALAAPDLDPANVSIWLDKTFEILGLALRNLGIGAKTSSGYGRMTLTEEKVEIPIDPELAKLVEEIKNLPDKAFSSSSIEKQLLRWLKYESDPHSKIVAQAIVDRVNNSGNAKQVSSKLLYQRLLAALK